ncbi:NAD(P)/FAD-dependent oxidoreductase [Pseudactinotalea sp. HY158]|uniref:NAD(P)/FAD-dependent oxidoreductase n=1 Tax=Pseudactinotalea sp. HY158 TaxID=2654547 RepID=UPI00129CD209|nr:FAD-dependent oxidoreductase [Pseudactinotalea sp. HY158]QGH69594.1 ferredoxin reductase [Pseudactinotalea sp. HY158]
MSEESGSGTVIVGAGLAAAHVASTLTGGGYTGPITLIGDEGERPYERPPLSKEALQGTADYADAYVHDEAWYREAGIALHLDDAAVAIDRAARTVRLTSGATVGYGRLVLATGAHARALPVPGADADGVFMLRRMADSKRLRDVLTTGARVVIVGGGWIGLEVAAAAVLAGASVTVLEAGEAPLGRILGSVLGDHFAGLHRAHGVDLRTRASVVEIVTTEGRATGVRLDSGEELPADVVLVGIGAVPNTELASAAGLDVDGGVLTDEHLVTSDPAVLAIGDVANAHNSLRGERLRVEHWDNAIRHGTLAGRVILGENATYDWQPYFFTDQYNLGMEYVGLGSGSDILVVRGDLTAAEAAGEFIAFWLREGVVTAAMNVNIWDVNDDLRALIGRRIEPGRLADDGIGLADLA